MPLSFRRGWEKLTSFFAPLASSGSLALGAKTAIGCLLSKVLLTDGISLFYEISAPLPCRTGLKPWYDKG